MNENKSHYCPYCSQETFCPFLDEERNKFDNNLNSNKEGIIQNRNPILE